MARSVTNRTSFERARKLVMRYGWNTTCFQIVNPGIEYWFGGDGESVVGYVTSGKTRVVAGAPVCPEASLPAVVEAFERDARTFGLDGKIDWDRTCWRRRRLKQSRIRGNKIADNHVMRYYNA